MSQTEVDPAWKAIQKGKNGFFVWRIEDFKVVPVPKGEYGKFYKGDAYIVYKAAEVQGRLVMNVHFWIGSDCSQDEYGTAAYKTIELDDYLGGAPVQHREVDGNESTLFCSYFKGGIITMQGGVKSGFNHHVHVQKERLFLIKGKNCPKVKEVKLDWESFNDGDVFIVELAPAFFVWEGKDSSRKERIKAQQQARLFRDSRKGAKGDIFVVRSGEEDNMAKDEKDLFFSKLPLAHRRVKTASEGGADEAVARTSAQAIKLYKCTDEDGTLKVTEVKQGPLVKNDLSTNDSFIIDNGEQGIWVWNGKKASKTERKEAMSNATGFLKKKGYNTRTQVTKVCDGGEPPEFTMLFKSWPKPEFNNKAFVQNRIAKTVQTKFDANTMHENRALAAETGMVDDGTGKVEIWHVHDEEFTPIPSNQRGVFYSGDCYVIKYGYRQNNRDRYIIYYWLGRNARDLEKGSAALHTVRLDDELGGAAVQIRVVQDKEPPHFMAMFEGRMIIYDGDYGKPSRDLHLMRVRGTTPSNTKAVEVELTAASLNSNDSYVLCGKVPVHMWFGKGSTGDEREMARKLADQFSGDKEKNVEGQEKADFWSKLGGKCEYSNDKRLQDENLDRPARLFQASNASGQFIVEEVPNFNQEDLNPDDVMLLDAGHTLFVWIGEGANATEKNESVKTAMEYIDTDPSGRDPDTPIMKIKQDQEPPTFTGFFGEWNYDLWSKGRSYEEYVADLKAGNKGIAVQITEESLNGTTDFGAMQKYSVAELQVGSEDLPEGVTADSRELFLSEEDFKQVFNCTYEEFIKKPTWKQIDMKKKASMF